jgi:glyoxylase-like metal-dependent hydrolase (beta-lactamase superfamily II)
MLIPIALPICYSFLLKGERPVLVDTGRPRDFPALENALWQHGVTPADLSLILHTHGHWDHAGSTAALQLRTRAPIAVHAADVPMMRRGDNGNLRPISFVAWVLRPLLDGRFPPVEPNLLIDCERSLAEYGVSARIISTPGHTAGSLSVMTDEGDVLIGDLLMGGFLGGWLRPHRPGLHYYADDVGQVRESVRKILALKPRRLYPAHGGPLEPADVQRWLRDR